jgi:phosphoglycerol transferase MdoB-like AlkP superfamily enzyme
MALSAKLPRLTKNHGSGGASGNTRTMQRITLGALLTLSLLLVVLYSEKFASDPAIQLGTPFEQSLHDSMYAYIAGLHCVAFASLLLFLTRRFLFSVGATLALAASICLASEIKYSYLKTKLLFHDIYFHLKEPAEIEFFVFTYPILVLLFAAVVAAAFVLLFVLWRLDRKLVPRVIAMAVFVASAYLANYAASQERQRDKQTHFINGFFDQNYLSGFVLSARTFVELLDHSFELPTLKANTPVSQPVRPPYAEANSSKPNIIVVLHESSVDPSIYWRGVEYQVPSTFFSSGDGVRRRQLVQIWGGRTWISEYGFLLGIDLSYFGDFKGFLGVTAAHRFKNTFPQELSRLGYTTIANYPSPPTFLNTKRFFESIGFNKVYEPRDMNLFIKFNPNDRPRDRAYYNFMMDDLKGRKDAGEQGPFFYFVWTTATHVPYDASLFPQERAAEIIPGNLPAEFARRQRIAADDLAWFQDSLRVRFPGEKFLIAGFGDHHPYITQEYYDVSPQRPPNVRPFDKDEGQMKTYYRIDGINFSPAYDQLPTEAEIGFLGEIIMDAARLPASPAIMARRALRMRCAGHWADCPDQEAVLNANTLLSSGAASLFSVPIEKK